MHKEVEHPKPAWGLMLKVLHWTAPTPLCSPLETVSQSVYKLIQEGFMKIRENQIER